MPRAYGTVRHSVDEFVQGQAHTNGIKSIWAVLKRTQEGLFDKIGPSTSTAQSPFRRAVLDCTCRSLLVPRVP